MRNPTTAGSSIQRQNRWEPPFNALVAAEVGVALAPRMALPADTHGISLHPLAQPVTRTVSALTRVGDARQPHLNQVLDSLRTVSTGTTQS